MSRYWLVKTKWTDPMKEDSYDRIELTEEELKMLIEQPATYNNKPVLLADKIRKVLE